MNCKPGDLAIVIRARKTPEMLGRIVKVVRQFRGDEIFSGPNGRVLASDDGELTWVIQSTDGSLLPSTGLNNGKTYLLSERAFYDKCLMPIRRLPETEITDEQIKEPA